MIRGVVEVQTYSGYKGGEEPRKVKPESGWTRVRILDRWIEEDESTRVRSSCFRVIDASGNTCTLRYYHGLKVWYCL